MFPCIEIEGPPQIVWCRYIVYEKFVKGIREQMLWDLGTQLIIRVKYRLLRLRDSQT